MYFSLSKENVIKGRSFVDFEKVNSLDGVFLANKYELPKSKLNGRESDKIEK